MYGFVVQAEVLKNVYKKLSEKKEEEIEPQFKLQVELALKSTEIADDLKKHLETYGRIRLQTLIGKAPQNDENEKTECENYLNTPQFIHALTVAQACSVSLGHYLGDFCVLLYDQLSGHNFMEFILAGGVLSGEKSGGLIVRSAKERINQYGLNVSFIPDSHILRIDEQRYTQSDQPFKPKPNDDDTEHGAYGAACYSAACYLRTKQQEGLQKIRQALLTEKKCTNVALTDTEIVIGDYNIKFQQYALSKSEVYNFVVLNGSKWGYYQSDKIFIRWEDGQ